MLFNVSFQKKFIYLGISAQNYWILPEFSRTSPITPIENVLDADSEETEILENSPSIDSTILMLIIVRVWQFLHGDIDVGDKMWYCDNTIVNTILTRSKLRCCWPIYCIEKVNEILLLSPTCWGWRHYKNHQHTLCHQHCRKSSKTYVWHLYKGWV